MAKKLETVWQIDPHTLRKHRILQVYWQAWLPIMASWSSKLVYIDGFAGPGKYKNGEDGSPVIVVKEAQRQIGKIGADLVMLFIEKDPARYQHLIQTLKALEPLSPKIYYECINGEFDEQMRMHLDALKEANKKLAPALVFIDPFGFSHTPFETIANVLTNPRTEVLITFMFEEINRFLAHPTHPETYDQLFGTDHWKRAIDLNDPAQRKRTIHDLYRDQLRTVAKYVRSFEMTNRGNSTDYFLFFATNSLKGLEKMKEAMWTVDPTGEFEFSDFTEESGLLSLFAEDPNIEGLKGIILREFKGKTVSIEDLATYVLTETGYLPKHLKVPILKPMEYSNELEIVKAKPGRRRGTFPPETTVRIK